MRLTPAIPMMLSLSLFALTGCEGLLTAPNAGGNTTDSKDQVTKEVTDETKPTTTFMYVMNFGETIDEVNLKTMAVTQGVMKTGSVPNQLLSRGVVTYLVNSFDHNILKLDLRARTTLDTIELANASNPMTLHVTEGEKSLVINYMSADVAFLDLSTKQVEKTLDLPNGKPGGGAAIADGKAYVAAVDATYGGEEVNWAATYTFSGVHVIDLATRSLVKTIALADDANPYDVSVSPDGKIFVGVKDGLAIIDPATDAVTGSVAFGESVSSVQYVSATKAYGSVFGGLVSFNPSTGAILKGAADKIAVDGGGAFKIFKGGAYVTSFGNDTVSVIDLATEAASGSPIPVGDGPQDLSFVTVED